MKTDSDQYPNLGQFLGGYFHQDWADDASDQWQVVAEYIDTTWREDIEKTIAEIKAFLAAHGHETLAAVTRQFNPSIITGENDQEAATWLRSVASVLEQDKHRAPTRPVSFPPLSPHYPDGSLKGSWLDRLNRLIRPR